MQRFWNLSKQFLRFPIPLAMRFASIIPLLAAPFVVSGMRVSWDPVYDQGMQSLTTVTCSDGSNGLLVKGYNVFEDLPTFPNIGGFSGVATWNSPYCGSSHFPALGFVLHASYLWLTPFQALVGISLIRTR